jgi:hypothetical protein
MYSLPGIIMRGCHALIIEAPTAAAHSLPRTAAPAGRDGVIHSV